MRSKNKSNNQKKTRKILETYVGQLELGSKEDRPKPPIKRRYVSLRRNVK